MKQGKCSMGYAGKEWDKFIVKFDQIKRNEIL